MNANAPAGPPAGSSRRGGRESRRVLRSDRTPRMLPALKRNLPTVEPMNPEQIERIDRASLDILEDVGVVFRDPQALDDWRRAGADVHDDARVHLDQGLVRELISSIPSGFTYHARNPANNLPFGHDHAIFVPMTGAPYLRDLDDTRRSPTLADLATFHKLAHMSPALHSTAHHIVEPAGGIGAAIVRRFRAEGGGVAVADRDVSGIEAEAHLPGDLLESSYADGLPDAARRALGRIDIVVNNAGVITRGDVTATRDADWSLSVGVNVEAPFRICRAAIPIMAAAGGGAIINISSCWGLRPGPGHAVYCMTKAAIASLTQCMGLDHAHQNIRINAVAPNEVNTPMLRTGFTKRGFDPDTAVAALGKTVPLGRIAEPEDIADVVLFLASDAARYMCGSIVEVNGGKPVS